MINTGIEERIARLEAEAAVRQTIASFSDAVGRDDRPAFHALWTENCVWEIGEPYLLVGRGIGEIAPMLDRLMVGWEFFVQLTHSSAVDIADDLEHATARSEIREFARQTDQSRSYDNFAIYDDALVKVDGHWRFARRSYHYIWVDDTRITGHGYKLPPNLGRPLALQRRLD